MDLLSYLSTFNKDTLDFNLFRDLRFTKTPSVLSYHLSGLDTGEWGGESSGEGLPESGPTGHVGWGGAA